MKIDRVYLAPSARLIRVTEDPAGQIAPKTTKDLNDYEKAHLLGIIIITKGNWQFVNKIHILGCFQNHERRNEKGNYCYLIIVKGEIER